MEVKGLANESGGVLFTNKEWETAFRLKDEYILAMVMMLIIIPRLALLQTRQKSLMQERILYQPFKFNGVFRKVSLKD